MGETKTGTRNEAPILITGATGRQGGTGLAAARELLKRDYPVRTLVRQLDARAEILRELGAEVVVGDYSNYSSLLAALEGVESAYFCYPIAAGIAEAAGLFAGAGRQLGLKRIVDLSLATTAVNSASPQGRAQWVAEQIFEWAGMGGTHLRIAAFFMENVTLIDGPGIRTSARIANSFGDKPLSWISGEDVGAIAASLLVDPELCTERVLIAGGVERLTFREVASKVSDAVGQTVHYEELTPQEWKAELIAASGTQDEVNSRGIDHLIAQSIALRAGPVLPITDHVRKLTTRIPTSFAAFSAQHRLELTPLTKI
jgi:NAD(P)H dehydrogenase (quinone)